MPQEPAFIEVRNLTFAYQPGKPVLIDVNMEVRRGEFICILGPSGCGKSTLMNILSGLAPAIDGSVKIEGEELYDQGKARKRPNVGYVFQDHRLLPWKTVRENVAFSLRAAKVPFSEWEERIRRYLRMLQIEDYIDAWPLNLSGGQRQRVSIARALAIDPTFVLMDEPFSTLDEVTARFQRAELLDIWSRTHKTILFVTHSIREAVYLADRIFIMTKGPGTIFKVLPIHVPRPRRYEDVRLAEIESNIVDEVLANWGYPVDERPESSMPESEKERIG